MKICLFTIILTFLSLSKLSALEICKPNDNRVTVPVWTPKENKNGSFSPSAPGTDGQIVYALLYMDREKCENRKQKDIMAFEDTGSDHGFSNHYLNMRPTKDQIQITNGACYISGFFMYEQVYGMHQGSTESYYTSIPKVQVALSGRFCLERDTIDRKYTPKN